MGKPRVWLLAVAVWPMVSSAGCTAIENLDRFKTANNGSTADAAAAADASGKDGGGSATDLSCDNPATLCVRLKGFTPHLDELVDLDLVSADHTLRARAILDPMGMPDADIVLPLAIPSSEVAKKGAASALHLEIWGDKSGDRLYTADKDHDWVEPLPGNAHDVFMHNSAFTNLLPRPRSIGGDFEITLTGFAIHKGKQFEVMVIEADSGRTVGLCRLHAIPDAPQLTCAIPDIIDTGSVAYRVEYYADVNGNGKYDGVGPDHSWVVELESDATGVHIMRPHSGPGIEFAPLKYQFAFKN